MTDLELTDIITNTVHATLCQLGLKASSLNSGRIYRSDMVKVIGRRNFEQAVDRGQIRVSKGDHANSKVWTKRSEWDAYLKQFINQKL